MVFLFFAAGLFAIFFVASLIALHCGRACGQRYRKHEAPTTAWLGLDGSREPFSASWGLVYWRLRFLVPCWLR